MQPAAPPLEVTPEELETLLEGVREALGEAGYQKLKAAIRTLSYVTELLENREATLQSLRQCEYYSIILLNWVLNLATPPCLAKNARRGWGIRLASFNHPEWASAARRW
jgi:hypothetical protein